MTLTIPRTEEEVIQYIKWRFGDCRVGVELTDNQIRTAMFDALEELSRWIPKRTITTIPVPLYKATAPDPVLGAPGLEVYNESVVVKVEEYFDESKNFRGLIEVVPSEDDITAQFRHGVVGFGFPMPVNTAIGQSSILNVPIWQYEMMMGWLETFQKTFAASFEWKFHDGYLYMWYIPSMAQKVAYIWTASRKLEEVDVKYRKWFLDYTYAACQMIIAEIRGKLASGVPGPAGNSITLNADTIRSEAVQRMQELREDIMQRSGSESFEWDMPG